MKKYSFLFVIIFLLFSCAEDKKTMIIGFWQLDKVKTNQKIENYNEYEAAMDQLIRTTSIQFNADNTFGATIWGDTSFGYWTMKNDSLYIEDISNNNVFSIYVKEINSNQLLLQEKADSIVEILTFIKEEL